MNFFVGYRNFYYCQHNHPDAYLAKNGWWYGKESWRGEDPHRYGYVNGYGDYLEPKYDTNLIYVLSI